MLTKIVAVLSLLVLTCFIAVARQNLPDSSTIRNIDVKNRIAKHFIEIEPDLALFYADSAIYTATNKNYPLGLAQALSTKAEILKNKGGYQQSLQYYSQVINIVTALGDTIFMAETYNSLGELQMALKNYSAAIDNYKRAVDLESKLNQPALYVGVYTGLWTAYWHLNEHQVASKFRKKAMEIFQNHQNNELVNKQFTRIGETFRKMNDLDRALDYYLKALQVNKESESKINLAAIQGSIGEIYLAKKNPGKALEFLNESLRIQTELGNKKELTSIYLNIGHAYLKLKDYSTALIHAHLSAELARDIDNKHYLLDVYKLFADIYEQADDLQMSIIYYKKYADLKDKVFDQDNSRQIAELSAQYEVNQKKKELAILSRDHKLLQAEAENKKLTIRNDRIILVLLSSLTFFIIALLALFWRQNNARKKVNTILSEQLSEISEKKQKIEEQRDTIARNNLKLERAQKVIQLQNKKLLETNEKLEEKVNERTEELKEAYDKLEFHFDNTPLAIMEWNQQMKLIRWSSQAEHIYGWKANEVLGKSIYDINLIHEDDLKKLKRSLEELLSGIIPRNFMKLKSYTKNGNVRDVEWSNSVLFQQDGQTVDSILSIANDVTTREKALRELKVSNRELDNFVYRASHDLQGPISRIQGILNLAMMESKESVSRQYFEILGTVAFEFEKVLSRLSIVHNIYQLDIKPVDLNVKDEIQRIVKNVNSRIKDAPMRYQLDIPEGLKWKSDRSFFQIIFENLTENAINHKLKNDISYLKLKAEKHNSHYVKFTISDNGIGIPQDAAHRVFDMFFQSSAKPLKSGLGLYMVKKAVEKLGGEIELKSPYKDTIFEIKLPIL